MKLNKYWVQLIAILAICALLVMALVPSVHSGVVDESVSKFAKALGMMITVILYGSASGANE